jgi:agmatine/peptidylarginine deiminase
MSWRTLIVVLLMVLSSFLSACQALPNRVARADLSRSRVGRLHCPPGGVGCRAEAFQLTDQEKFFLPPEYSPTRAVMVSEHLLRESQGLPLLHSLLAAGSEIWVLGIDKALFEQTQQQLYLSSDPSGRPRQIYQLPIATDSIWTRDYGPLTALPSADYQGPALDYKLINSFYYPDRRRDDRVPASLSRILNSPLGPLQEKTVFTSRLALALEGGNFMCTRQDCYASQHVVNRNVGQNYPFGRALRTPADIQAEFSSEIQQPVHFIPALPGESTGHIDMWTKFLDENTLVVAQLSDQTLALAPPEEHKALRQIQAFLEQQATGLDARGKPDPDSLQQQVSAHHPALKILRIPMPLPQLRSDLPIYRSYTNALLVNHTALVPRYRTSYLADYPDQMLLNDYERDVEQVYRQAGYTVRWVLSDSWIASGGAVHCVTMQVPALATEAA